MTYPPQSHPPHRRSEPLLERDDIEAALETRKEFGAEMEPALVDSFVARIEHAAEQRARADFALETRRIKEHKRDAGRQLTLAIVSLVMAIPLSAIGAGVLGFPGLLIAWIGIVLVNVTFALRKRLG